MAAIMRMGFELGLCYWVGYSLLLLLGMPATRRHATPRCWPYKEMMVAGENNNLSPSAVPLRGAPARSWPAPGAV